MVGTVGLLWPVILLILAWIFHIWYLKVETFDYIEKGFFALIFNDK